jgi:hypothetical protein
MAFQLNRKYKDMFPRIVIRNINRLVGLYGGHSKGGYELGTFLRRGRKESKS